MAFKLSHLFFDLYARLRGGKTPPPPADLSRSIYDFTVDGLTGTPIEFAAFKGRKLLIVNTASNCGFTNQYEGLEALSKAFPDTLSIVGFPANDFANQEKGSNDSIASFCQRNYGVTFPMAAKISVTGPQIAPIYQWLTRRQFNGLRDAPVKWNFQKYLLNEQGRLIAVFPPDTRPDAPEVLAAVAP